VFHALGGIGVGRGTEDKEPLQETLTEVIRNDESPWFYVEGTRVRSKDSEGNELYGSDGQPIDTRKISDVRKGALELSLATGTDVLPLAILGTADNDYRTSRLPIYGVVLEPLDPIDFQECSDPVTEMQLALGESLNLGLELGYAARDYMLKSL